MEVPRVNAEQIPDGLARLGDLSRMVRDLFASCVVPLQVFERDGTSVLVNEAFRALFGSEPPDGYSLFEDEVAARSGIREHVMLAFAGTPTHIPTAWYGARELTRFQVPSLRRVAVESNFVPFFDSSGRVSAVLALFNERTAEMLAKEELAAALVRERDARARADAERTRLNTLFDLAPANITMHEGPDLVFVLSNARHKELSGNRPLLGKPLREAMPELDPMTLERLRETYETGVSFVARATPVTVRGLDGVVESRFFDVVWQPLASPTGAPEGLMTFSYDVTDLVSARDQAAALSAELSASEIRFKVVQESSPDGFMMFKSVRDEADQIVDFAWVYTNPAAERIVGKTDTELVGQRLLDVMPGNKPEGLFDAYVRVVETGEMFRTELAYAHEGLEHSFRLVALKLEDGFAVTFEDVTERKRAEQERERLLATLTIARVEAETQKVQAETANRLKDEFLATISHELRTPLQAILGWATLLSSDGKLDPRQRKGIEVIQRNAQAQGQLIEDILEVSRIITGKLRLSPQVLSVHTLLDEALESVRLAANAKQIVLTTSVAADIGELMGDPDRLRQVVWNLLANAVKFTPVGGQVTVRAARRLNEIDIAVVDSGHGIDSEFLPHVFERFRQADGSSTRAHGGLGLGLAIVRHLVELHGGQVEAASDGLGKGSTFRVTLPTDGPPLSSAIGIPNKASQTESRPPEREPPLSGKRVIVVDDDTDTLELLTTILRAAGANVDAACSVAECMTHLQSSIPDAIVSDIGMPHEDGYALIARLKGPDSVDAIRRIPVIALTAYARPEDRARALGAGFQDHVAKPVDAPKLVEVVANAAGAVQPEQACSPETHLPLT